MVFFSWVFSRKADKDSQIWEAFKINCAKILSQAAVEVSDSQALMRYFLPIYYLSSNVDKSFIVGVVGFIKCVFSKNYLHFI